MKKIIKTKKEIKFQLKPFVNKNLSKEKVLFAEIQNKKGKITMYTFAPVEFVNEGAIITRLFKNT